MERIAPELPGHNIKASEEHAYTSGDGRSIAGRRYTDGCSQSQPSVAPFWAGQFLLFSGEGQVYAETARTGWRKLERKSLFRQSSVSTD